MLKCRTFPGPDELTNFVNTQIGDLTKIVTITFDTASGQYVLFYKK